MQSSQPTSKELNVKAAYEIHNPSFNDMTIDEQIEVGINDWCAEGRDGHPYFGRSKEQAESIRAQYEGA
jgi:hypothetical protein